MISQALLRKVFKALISVGVFSFVLLVIVAAPGNSKAADFVRPQDQQALQDYASKIDEEYSYRAQVDAEGAVWARELMLMYKWSHLYPTNLRAMPETPEARAALSKRMQSEFAWLAVTGQGLLATFDFKHAEQSFFGSTSRFVGALMVSSNFWTEVQTQCIEIQELKAKAKGEALGPINIRDCAERLRRDLSISQAVGSNVSLFVSGGIVVGLGKKLFTRYASKWVTARVLPLLPAFARTKWALGALTAGIVIVPAGILYASVQSEHEASKVFIDNLQTSLDQNQVETDRASVMRLHAFETERYVLEFTVWIGSRMPKSPSALTAVDDRTARNFLLDVRMMAPRFTELASRKEELEAKRASLEQELSSIPGISTKLAALVEERKHSALSETDAKLFRSAQYLASLRLTLKILAAAEVSVASIR